MSDNKEEIKKLPPATTTIWPWLPDRDTAKLTVDDIKRQIDAHDAYEAEALMRGEEPIRILDYINVLPEYGSLSVEARRKLKELGLNLSLLTSPAVTTSYAERALLVDLAARKKRVEVMSAWWDEKVARPMLNQMLIERRKDLQTRMLVALRFHAKTKQEQQKAQQREYLKLANIGDSFLDAATGDSVVKMTRETYDDIMRMHSSTLDMRVRAMCAHVLDCDDARRYNAEDLLQSMGHEATVTHYSAADNSVMCNIKPRPALGVIQLPSHRRTADEHEAYMRKDTNSGLSALFDIEPGGAFLPYRGDYTVRVLKPRPVDIQCKLNVNYADLRIDEPGTIVVDSVPDYMRDTARSSDPASDAVGYDFHLGANSGGGQSRVGSFKTEPGVQMIGRAQMKTYAKLFTQADVKVGEIDRSTIVKQTTATIAQPHPGADSRKYNGPKRDERRNAKKLKRKAQKQQRK